MSTRMASTRRDVGDAAILPEVVLLSWLRFRTEHNAVSIGRSLQNLVFSCYIVIFKPGAGCHKNC